MEDEKEHRRFAKIELLLRLGKGKDLTADEHEMLEEIILDIAEEAIEEISNRW